jgi:hypothetical protein
MIPFQKPSFYSYSSVLICAFCLVMLVPARSAAQQATLTDDAQTSAVAPNQNFGSNASVRVSGTNIRGFFKFNLTPHLPAGTTGGRVGKATLKLFVGAVNAPGTFDIFRVNGPWNEGTVTGSTAPPLGALESAITLDVSQANQWVTVDLTRLVKEWLDGTLPNEGIAIVANASVGNVLFNSKENQTTSHGTSLEVVLNHAATADRAIQADRASIADAVESSAILNGNQISGDLTNANIAGSKVNGPVANATNADSVINGVYTIGDQVIEGVKTFNAPVNTSSHYSINGERVLGISSSSFNLFAGVNAGRSNRGIENSFFGPEAGFRNEDGGRNSFFGTFAGLFGRSGSNNSFFGFRAGHRTEGHQNSFFGSDAGSGNENGSRNSFFGYAAGRTPGSGDLNSFFGYLAGHGNTSGNRNTFLGAEAGFSHVGGELNVFVGYGTGIRGESSSLNTFIGATVGATPRATPGISNSTALGARAFIGTIADESPGISNATALGANAQVTRSNSLVLGSINGVNGATVDTNVGIGTTAPQAKLHVEGGNIFIGSAGQGIILRSPSGNTCRLVTIDDAGGMVLTTVACL